MHTITWLELRTISAISGEQCNLHKNSGSVAQFWSTVQCLFFKKLSQTSGFRSHHASCMWSWNSRGSKALRFCKQLGHIKKSLVYHSIQLKKWRAGGRIFFLFSIFFVWPSPTAAHNFKAIKQSINKTKLLFIDRLGEKAIIQSINLAKVFTQDVLAHTCG